MSDSNKLVYPGRPGETMAFVFRTLGTKLRSAFPDGTEITFIPDELSEVTVKYGTASPLNVFIEEASQYDYADASPMRPKLSVIDGGRGE